MLSIALLLKLIMRNICQTVTSLVMFYFRAKVIQSLKFSSKRFPLVYMYFFYVNGQAMKPIIYYVIEMYFTLSPVWFFTCDLEL